MGGKSKTKTSFRQAVDNRTTNQYRTDVNNVTSDLSQSRVDGSLTNVAAGGDIGSLTMTDHGAVDASFDFASDLGGEAFGFGSDALYFADQAGERSAMINLHAMDSVGSTTGRALDQVASLSAQQSDMQRGMVEEIGGLAHAFQSQGTSEQLKLVGFVAGGVMLTVVIVAVTARGKK